MSSVTNRIKEISQPRGGYVNPKMMDVRQLEDGKTLQEENVHASIIGMAVDYLTRFVMTKEVEESFKISIMGANAAEILGRKGSLKEISVYLSQIEGLDDNSIKNVCKCCAFDVWYRNPMAAAMAKPAAETNPDEGTINNIRILVNRSLDFFKEYGPITSDGFTFEKEGYTKTVDSGDGDFLTKDTLWDFKVSASKPTNKHTLQLLMYWIMGQHSKKEKFKNIKKIGIFNPRLNCVYTLSIDKISKDIITDIEQNVICY